MTHTLHNATAEELVTRLRKVEGQVRGLQHMIDRGESCIDVLTQVAATRAALTAVGRGLLDCEIGRVIDRGDEAADSSVADLLVAVDLLVGH